MLGIRWFQENGSLSISPEDLIFHINFLSVLKISKTFVFFFRTSNEYSKKYRQGSVFTTDPWKRILKTDPCPYLVKYSLDVLKKKTKVLDIFNTDNKCFFKNNIESSPQEIWIRIRFLEINGSPSLLWKSYQFSFISNMCSFENNLLRRPPLILKIRLGTFHKFLF